MQSGVVMLFALNGGMPCQPQRVDSRSTGHTLRARLLLLLVRTDYVPGPAYLVGFITYDVSLQEIPGSIERSHHTEHFVVMKPCMCDVTPPSLSRIKHNCQSTVASKLYGRVPDIIVDYLGYGA